jgi:hypothetical protein
VSELRDFYLTNRTHDFTTIMVGLTPDEADLIRRLREMKAQRHQLAIIQFTDKGLQCRKVGRLEG